MNDERLRTREALRQAYASILTLCGSLGNAFLLFFAAWWKVAKNAPVWIFFTLVIASVATGVMLISYWVFIDTQDPIKEVGVARILGRDADGEYVPRIEFAAGDSIVVEREICATHTTRGSIRRWLENAAPMPMTSSARTPIIYAGCQVTRILVELPEDLHPGYWRYHSEGEFDLNPLRQAGSILGPARHVFQPLTLLITANRITEHMRSLRVALNAEKAKVEALKNRIAVLEMFRRGDLVVRSRIEQRLDELDKKRGIFR